MSDAMIVKILGYASYRDLRNDWANNFLTVGGFASHHGIDEVIAQRLIKDARWLYE